MPSHIDRSITSFFNIVVLYCCTSALFRAVLSPKGCSASPKRHIYLSHHGPQTPFITSTWPVEAGLSILATFIGTPQISQPRFELESPQVLTLNLRLCQINALPTEL